MAYVFRKSISVNRLDETRVPAKSFQLRSEDETIALPAVVERLLSHSIARKGKRSLLTIPKRDGKHANGTF